LDYKPLNGRQKKNMKGEKGKMSKKSKRVWPEKINRLSLGQGLEERGGGTALQGGGNGVGTLIKVFFEETKSKARTFESKGVL